KPKSFSNGSVLCSGASYKLVFESNKDSYVYIFQIDSAHKIFRLFPSGDFKKASTRNQNPVKKETEYFVPGKKTSFKLDKVVGKETIYFVVTHKRNKKLEAQYEKMVTQQEGNSEQTRGAVRKEWHSTMQKRGIEPEVSNDPGIFPTFLTDVCEGCAYNLTFQHSDCQ
ncbi:MAG: DUF4384 domain-containing protein, partial [Thiomargarita sp.]|nr:DUF4384 domain-containing protein [Thiomargarita sp.]